MTKNEYELYLLNKVQWWLYIRNVEDIYSKKNIACYQGNVFGVHLIIEVEELIKIADKHGVSPPHCIVGG